MMGGLHDVQNQFLAHALSQYPRESCGVFVMANDAYEFVLLENQLQAANQDFEALVSDYKEAVKGKTAVAFVHSHTNGNDQNTPHDRAQCRAMNVPWLTLILPQQKWIELHHQDVSIPILNRPWDYGLLDCYSIVKDTFGALGIPLSDYPRAPIFEWNTNPLWDQYSDNFEKEGFVEVFDGPQPYDLLLMKARSQRHDSAGKVNHAGVMWFDGEFIHHPIGKNSIKELWDGYWRLITCKIVRHRNIIGVQGKVPKIELSTYTSTVN
jgi:proteasome lid subunit RPN8/RPN11